MPGPERISLTIKDDQNFQCINCQNGYRQFDVKTVESALHIGLFTTDDITEGSSLTNPKYIIKIAEEGEENSRISLGNPQIVNEIAAPHILVSREWRSYWICILQDSISLGIGNEYEPLLKWDDPQSKSIVKMGFKIKFYYEYDHDDGLVQADIVIDSVASTEHSGVRWVKCSYGQIPENAFVGSQEGDRPIYVVRTTYNDSLLPGTVKKGATFCEVVRKSRLRRVNCYEVLVDFDGEWVKVSRKIPPLAVVAGRSSFHFFYIGRAKVNDKLTMGIISSATKALDIVTMRDQKKTFYEFEILCHKPPGLPKLIRHCEEEQEEEPKLKWVYTCGGRMPRNAFVVGSHKNQPILLIRAHDDDVHRIWYPGWMCYADDTRGYIAGDCKRIVEEYEVLCDFNGYWEKSTTELGIPKQALVLDKNKDDDDIYIARATYKDKLFCGRVIDMVCEIPLENVNLEVEEFEVLCL